MTGVEGLQNAGFEPVKVQLWLANRICGSLCCSVPSRPGSSRAAIGCRTAVGEIVARTAIEPHLRAVLAGNDAEAADIASDSFTVDNAGARAQAGQRLDDQREALRVGLMVRPETARVSRCPTQAPPF
jgi:hypothetical protein